MAFFTNDNLKLAYLDEGRREGPAVLLLHGFASSVKANWVDPGWIETLGDAGFRVLAFDHRGHGASDKPHEESAYPPQRMARDAVALLDHLSIDRAALFGYSVGARIAASAALDAPDRFPALIFGGLAFSMVEGVGNRTAAIADAMRAPSLEQVTDAWGRTFRAFADYTGADREALAACITASHSELTREEICRIEQPTLIAVGTKDDLAGSPEKLAALMPNAEPLSIEGRDHMLAVGDRTFKEAVLRFLEDHRNRL
ncbi:alpha/beta fold hydrolase [Consotaella aegiceratis]|uniref:alpha/beta fold hydrolase n=1 Tax=Consotaella aegiceratis TaxID=3097961 RepID=UPI002F424F43